MKVRPPAVAGAFYPEDRATLTSTIEELMFEVDTSAHQKSPKAIIAPHAGYIYSGPTAAAVYALLEPEQVTRVVLLGPCHRVLLSGLALPDADAFETPLGRVKVDSDAIAMLKGINNVNIDNASHALEHSLEVHIPFLQHQLREFRLLPLVVGSATAEMVAQVLERVWGGEETLIVISSDLSHYLPYEAARRKDTDTVDNILRMEPDITHEQACGATPINGLLACSNAHRLTPKVIDFRNSGDTAGPHDRVVGYASIALYEQKTEQQPGKETGQKSEQKHEQ